MELDFPIFFTPAYREFTPVEWNLVYLLKQVRNWQQTLERGYPVLEIHVHVDPSLLKEFHEAWRRIQRAFLIELRRKLRQAQRECERLHEPKPASQENVPPSQRELLVIHYDYHVGHHSASTLDDSSLLASI